MTLLNDLIKSQGDFHEHCSKFRIDVDIHSSSRRTDLKAQFLRLLGLSLPVPVFPQHPELPEKAGPENPPERHHWTTDKIYQTRGWLFPYIHSRVLPGEFAAL